MAMARAQHLEFGPPATPGLLRSVALALLAHGLLLLGLTVGIQWKHDIVQNTVEAELWSVVPQQAAAPAPLEVPPEPEPPQPAAQAKPEPPPAPPVEQPDRAAEAAIAIARDKAKQLKEEKAAQEKLDQAKARKDKLAKEKLAKEKAAKEKAAQEKLAAEKAAQDKQRKQQQDSKAQKDQKDQKRKQELADAKEAKQLDDLRAQNLKRIAGMAGTGGNGAPTATGSAPEASGPSPGYAGRIVARIKPNIVFTEDLRGNPRVEVDIRTSPSGAIISTRITQSSGVKAWDDAVMRAIEKTEMLPKDLNGSIPTSIQIGFRPKD